MLLNPLKKIKHIIEICIGKMITYFLLSCEYTEWSGGVEFLCYCYPANNVVTEENAKLYKPYRMNEVRIGRGTYIAANSNISKTDIGRFCSIGPNFMCGCGIHPINGISTSPAFYSILKQNGMSFSKSNKIEERKPIKIGNDVFIGMNVTILDGVTIGDGAVIAAGAVVVKNIQPYSLVGGVPAKHIKYRFNKVNVQKLLNIKWWDWDDKKLQLIEKYFFDVNKFISLVQDDSH
ncbi:MAG: CatB-related O-acetyltransferase [Bacteroidales bacterium]|jgi:acetyltransferase-like isoleucine patch superfamily enzyme|nr:CatB-related O-acetyltransferase [Bacteroidales bacterium]